MLDPASMEVAIAFLQVIMIDIALSGDNAIVIGMAVAGLAPQQRPRAIVLGVLAATVMRVIFSAFTMQLLQVVGLMFAGGILLLWVAWKMWRELREQSTHAEAEGEAMLEEVDVAVAVPKSPLQAITQILVADVSMSLDNVLAIAGAARDHAAVMVIGLVLSIALMGVAATFIARLLVRHRWIAKLGLLIILYVAIRMTWDGGWLVAEAALAN